MFDGDEEGSVGLGGNTTQQQQQQAALLISTIFGLYSMSDNANEQPPPSGKGVNANATNSPSYPMDEEEPVECIICFEDLPPSESGHCKPCNHAFHKTCWWQWENSYHERLQRQRQNGMDDGDEGGPKCCLCNTTCQQFVDHAGEPAVNPDPFVPEETKDGSNGFFGGLFGGGSQNDNGGPGSVAFRFIERIAMSEGAMGESARHILQQINSGMTDMMMGDHDIEVLRQLEQAGGGMGFPFFAGSRVTRSHPSNTSENTGSFNGTSSSTTPSLNEICPGCPIAVQYLVNSPRLNGRRGKVQQRQQSGRYLVKLDAVDGEDERNTLSLKPENILQLTTVKIFGLVSQPQFNGREGIIVSYSRERKRYVVRVAYVPTETREISLQSTNIRIPDGHRVRLEGLERAPQMNGNYGSVANFSEGRYEVRLSSQHSVRVKPENVML